MLLRYRYNVNNARNQCVDFLVKLGASSDDDLIIYESPPADLTNLFRNDAADTLFLREQLAFFFYFFSFLLSL